MKYLRWLAVIGLTLAAWFAVSPRFKDTRKDMAIRRGLQFLYGIARDPKHFQQYGGDLLWAFYCITSTSSDPELSAMAGRMGRERARLYRSIHQSISKDATANEVWWEVVGSHAAECLGFHDDHLKQELARAAGRYTAVEYFGFDPTREAPPSDVPEQCERCRKFNPRGVRTCQRCGAALVMTSPYDLMLDALVVTYTGDQYGVPLGAHLADVMRWLPALRPYRGREGGANKQWWNQIFAITHVIYTANDYSHRRLSPQVFPDEFAFLRDNLKETLVTDDLESAGEFLDTLKSFGVTERDPAIRSVIDYTVAHQNRDGSWGDPRSRDIYLRYHTTWTAIDGLRDYKW